MLLDESMDAAPGRPRGRGRRLRARPSSSTPSRPPAATGPRPRA